ncbi:MAG: hypothetical protein GXO36_03055 [Chloroflexi bacterium]|nr:hypothetical protein [Chloroflexota bacterium]
MPAVALRALRRDLARWAQQPPPAIPQWAEEIAGFFQRYANLVYRPGEQVTDLAPAYHSPPILTLELWRALQHRLPPKAEERLALSEALWALERREPRVLAARVLGTLPASAGEAVFVRFWPWLQDARWDATVERALLHHAAQPLLAEGRLLERLEPFLPPQTESTQAARALLALRLLPQHEGFDNTPALFRALHSGLVHLDPELKPEWAMLLRAIVDRWPAEAVPFLRRVRAITRDEKTMDWILRRLAETAPPNWRSRITALIQTYQPTPSGRAAAASKPRTDDGKDASYAA